MPRASQACRFAKQRPSPTGPPPPRDLQQPEARPAVVPAHTLPPDYVTQVKRTPCRVHCLNCPFLSGEQEKVKHIPFPFQFLPLAEITFWYPTTPKKILWRMWICLTQRSPTTNCEDKTKSMVPWCKHSLIWRLSAGSFIWKKSTTRRCYISNLKEPNCLTHSSWGGYQNSTKVFLATLVALHFTPVSK